LAGLVGLAAGCSSTGGGGAGGGVPDASGVFEGSVDAGAVEFWRIALGSMPRGTTDPEALIAEIEASTGLRGIEQGERDGSRLLVYGRYDSPESKQAQRDLERVRLAESGRSRPFAGAFFMPPSVEAAGGRNARYDLRNARRFHGEDAVYTLQVNVYGRGDGGRASAEDLAGFRELAERAVEALRAEGTPAFFFHGPNTSSVTVGIFGADDHDPTVQPPLESERLRRFREEFPHALFNGQGAFRYGRHRAGNLERQLQPSFLVAVPR